jgi:hypothetical protein
MSQDFAFPSRRMLLAGLCAGAVGSTAAASPILGFGRAGSGGEPPAARWGRASPPLKTAGLAEWSAAVGETFSLNSRNGSHSLRLVAVTPFPASGSRPRTLGRSRAFTVEFEPVAGPSLPAVDGLYQLVHSARPPLPIYMGAPSGQGRKTRVAAVFN